MKSSVRYVFSLYRNSYGVETCNSRSMLVNIHFSKYHIWKPLAPVHARVKGAKPLRSVAAFLCKPEWINETAPK